MKRPSSPHGAVHPCPLMVMGRRQALKSSAFSLAALSIPAGIAACGDRPPADSSAPEHIREHSFDEGFLFHLGDVPDAAQPDFDDSDWRPLDLPHDWSIEDLPNPTASDGADTSTPSLLVDQTPDSSSAPAVIGPFSRDTGLAATGYTVGGVGWYRKHFTLTELTSEQDPLVSLRFDGAYQNTDVWLNGRHLGFHPNGYTPSTYDFKEYLLPNAVNVVAVRVDNTGSNSRWYSGSGIYRHTWLTITNKLHLPLSALQITTPRVTESSATVQVALSIANQRRAAVDVSVQVVLYDPDGLAVGTALSSATLVEGDSTTQATFELDVPTPALWSVETPNLYTATCELLEANSVVDRLSSPFGVRTIAWTTDQGFLLNGTPVPIVGGNVHHDHGPMGAVALTRSEERRVELLKAAGFNAIRTAHNPPSPSQLDACDRLGMLVIDEFVDMWDKAKTDNDYAQHFHEWWEKDLTSMVLRDRNHPCIVLWSLGNEINSDATGEIGAALATRLRELDATRPLAVGGGQNFNPSSWAYVDVGDSHYNGGGRGFEDDHLAYPETPVIHSETFAATLYQDLAQVNDEPWLAGSWIWAAWDYLGEPGVGKTLTPKAGTMATIRNQSAGEGYFMAWTLYQNWGGFGYPYPYFQANCGDLDLIGQRKPQNYWRSATLGLTAVAMLVERPTPEGTEQAAVLWGYYDELESWTWPVPEGYLLKVRVYTKGNRATLTLNGMQLDITPDSFAQCRATFSVPYSPGSLTANVYQDDEPLGAATLETAGEPIGLRLVSDVESLTTARDELAHILVEVIDAEGRLVPDAAIKARFEVSGTGTLAAVGNGNPHNLDSFQQPQRFTWHGRALAILRPSKSPGTVVLTARASNMKPATLTLPVIDPQAIG